MQQKLDFLLYRKNNKFCEIMCRILADGDIESNKMLTNSLDRHDK